MRRSSTSQPFTCATCEVVIGGAPVVHVGLPFCCAGCVAGGPCVCSYDVDQQATIDLPPIEPVLVGAAAD